MKPEIIADLLKRLETFEGLQFNANARRLNKMIEDSISTNENGHLEDTKQSKIVDNGVEQYLQITLSNTTDGIANASKVFDKLKADIPVHNQLKKRLCTLYKEATFALDQRSRYTQSDFFDQFHEVIERHAGEQRTGTAKTTEEAIKEIKERRKYTDPIEPSPLPEPLRQTSKAEQFRQKEKAEQSGSKTNQR